MMMLLVNQIFIVMLELKLKLQYSYICCCIVCVSSRLSTCVTG